MNISEREIDFFPEIDDSGAYRPYRDTEDDLIHEERLKKFEAEISGEFGGSEPADGWGELPYDAEADRKRWHELEADFDRIFQNESHAAIN